MFWWEQAEGGFSQWGHFYPVSAFIFSPNLLLNGYS